MSKHLAANDLLAKKFDGAFINGVLLISAKVLMGHLNAEVIQDPSLFLIESTEKVKPVHVLWYHAYY